jgi:hypothetical protein
LSEEESSCVDELNRVLGTSLASDAAVSGAREFDEGEQRASARRRNMT